MIALSEETDVCWDTQEMLALVSITLEFTEVVEVIDVEDEVTKELVVRVELTSELDGEVKMNKPATTTTPTTIRPSNAGSAREMAERVPLTHICHTAPHPYSWSS
jgi:hypothetical protein